MLMDGVVHAIGQIIVDESIRIVVDGCHRRLVLDLLRLLDPAEHVMVIERVRMLHRLVVLLMALEILLLLVLLLVLIHVISGISVSTHVRWRLLLLGIRQVCWCSRGRRDG